MHEPVFNRSATKHAYKQEIIIMPKEKISNKRRTYNKDTRGRKQGKYIEYFTNGKRSVECSFVDDEIHGEFKGWNIYGIMYEHSYYVHGELDGRFSEWFKDGKLERNCYYKNGIRDGESKQWNSSGELEFHNFYKNNTDITEDIQRVVKDINAITKEEGLIIFIKFGVKCLCLD